MIRTMVLFVLSMAIISPSIAQQQPPFRSCSDDWWYLAVPAWNSPGCTSQSNQRKCEPAVKRDDYTYTPGIGAHKVHSKLATWNEARQICKDEGGHLAIINSVAEAKILGTLLDQAEPEKLYAFIGFHNWFDESQYVTIHDQSLAEAGFTQWSPGEPNNRPGGGERCGCVYKPGALCDFFCATKWVFICEIPLNNSCSKSIF